MSVIEKTGIEKYLSNPENYKIECTECVTSTNDVVKSKNEREWYTLIADTQKCGRGRLSRTFHSPVGTGIYMSVLLYPRMSAADCTRLTVCAAVSVAEALKELGSDARIKWVNDIFVNGKKVCGILCENVITSDGGTLKNKCIVGIGINVFEPEGGFPADIAETAGAVFGKRKPEREFLCKTAAAVLEKLYEYYPEMLDGKLFEKYRNLSCTVGKRVDVYPALGDGEKLFSGIAVGIDDEGALTVETDDGKIHRISAGEVRLKPGVIK